jgi:hypothetical protein
VSVCLIYRCRRNFPSFMTCTDTNIFDAHHHILFLGYFSTVKWPSPLQPCGRRLMKRRCSCTPRKRTRRRRDTVAKWKCIIIKRTIIWKWTVSSWRQLSTSRPRSAILNLRLRLQLLDHPRRHRHRRNSGLRNHKTERCCLMKNVSASSANVTLDMSTSIKSRS